MKVQIFLGLLVASHTSARPSLIARQDIDFDLLDNAPAPLKSIDDSSDYDPTAAAAAVIADISVDSLSLTKRDKIVQQAPGYTDNLPLGKVIISAPSTDCYGQSSFMGSKLFTSGPFDTTLCATACTATSDYNRRHPPANGVPRTCQFYNTFAMYKGTEYQGQYCSLYTEYWEPKYATSTGQTRNGFVYSHADSYMAANYTNTGNAPCPADLPGSCPRTNIISEDFEGGFVAGQGVAGQWAVTTLESGGLQYAQGLDSDTLTLQALSTQTPHSGNYSLAVKHSGQGATWRGVMTKIKLCPDTDYYVSAWVKNPNPSIQCWAGLRVNGQEYFNAIQPGNEWQFIAQKFSSGNVDPDALLLGGMASYCVTANTMAWDDFTISTTPVAPLQPYVYHSS